MSSFSREGAHYLKNEGVMERSWLAGARWSECNLESFCCVIPLFGLLLPRPALIWGHLAARRRSAASSVIYVGASSHVGPGGGGGARGPRRPRERIFLARARGARAWAIAPKRTHHPATGPRHPREGLLSWPRRPPPLLVRQGASRLARLRRSTEEVKNVAKTQQNTTK